MKYRTKWVCCNEIEFDIIDNKLQNVVFRSGCNGNLQGISRLVEDMDINEVIERLGGINCNGRGTSCPDQLTLALKEYISKTNKKIG